MFVGLSVVHKGDFLPAAEIARFDKTRPEQDVIVRNISHFIWHALPQRSFYASSRHAADIGFLPQKRRKAGQKARLLVWNCDQKDFVKSLPLE